LAAHRLLEHFSALSAVYRQAASTGDRDLVAEALYEIVFLHHDAGDAAAADAALRQVIDTGHPVWAAAAMICLAGIVAEDDAAAAEACTGMRCRPVTRTGRRTPRSGSVSCWRPMATSPEQSPPGRPRLTERTRTERTGAFLNLVNLLRGHEDTDGLRAAYQAAAALDNPEALYALDQLGEVLRRQGDTAGAHGVWQQAIDAGYENAADQTWPAPPPTSSTTACPRSRSR
jgi:hypothetical protein